MQYKQCDRILSEIIDSAVKPEIVFAIARLLTKKNFVLPRLGPYRKRGFQQVLWRLASNSLRSGEERWLALSKLLKANPVECRA